MESQSESLLINSDQTEPIAHSVAPSLHSTENSTENSADSIAPSLHSTENSTENSADSINPTNNSTNDPINSSEIVTVRPDAETLTRQRLPYFVGISEATAGSTGISLNLVVIPPGGAAEPHFHRDYETAIYLIKGRVETRYGKGLRQSVINEAGDFIFIPPGVPHQPHNLSATEPAQALVARNDPNEQENVVLYDPTAD